MVRRKNTNKMAPVQSRSVNTEENKVPKYKCPSRSRKKRISSREGKTGARWGIQGWGRRKAEEW